MRGPSDVERLVIRRRLCDQVRQATVARISVGFEPQGGHHLAGYTVPVGEEAPPGGSRMTSRAVFTVWAGFGRH